jgi:predicted phosphodiesterase
MGFHFDLKHANIAAYVTMYAAEPPRVDGMELYEFVEALSYADSTTFLRSESPDWLDEVHRAAQRCRNTLTSFFDPPGLPSIIKPVQVEKVLAPLRRHLTTFSLYGLVLYGASDSRGAEDTRAKLVGEVMARGDAAVLVLFPDRYGRQELKPREFLDPLPQAALIEKSAMEGPGVAFWTQRGTVCFVPERDVLDVAIELLSALRENPASLDKLLQRRMGSPARRLLHLSDLHFGSSSAATNLAMLQGELVDAVPEVQRVVITGDLFDNPEDQGVALYNAFRQNLERLSGKPAIAVPGNHDQRLMGNLGQSFEQVSKLPWRPVEVDDELRVVFLSFNSSIRGNFARGRITEGQLKSIGAELRSALTQDERREEYLKVALVHHHIFSFEAPQDTWVRKLLRLVRLSDEPFLLLEDADEFADWCARWKVSVVLHGHKHQARYFLRPICPKGGESHDLTAIGCGTSLGAEGLPLSYNIIEWDSQERRWNAKFFESTSGGPFIPKIIGISQEVGPGTEMRR